MCVSCDRIGSIAALERAAAERASVVKMKTEGEGARVGARRENYTRNRIFSASPSHTESRHSVTSACLVLGRRAPGRVRNGDSKRLNEITQMRHLQTSCRSCVNSQCMHSECRARPLAHTQRPHTHASQPRTRSRFIQTPSLTLAPAAAPRARTHARPPSVPCTHYNRTV